MADERGVDADGADEVQAFTYPTARRKNVPPAGLAAQGRIAERPPQRYAYDAHLPPVLRFDADGGADRYAELVEKARHERLTDEEADLLAEGLRAQQPWLEWAGKREKPGFVVDPVALHIHERVSAKAIVAVAARRDVQPGLFADPQQEYREAVQFYQHDVDWANRLILGDSLQVMASLAARENLAGKVQMIYMDPPYGIKFASNFQPLVNNRNVTDKPQDLTREPEMVRAYRDTWNLGVHSYLSYLRDRLTIARDLLHETGSIFVQIGDENVHRVRQLLDDSLGSINFIAQIDFVTTTGRQDSLLDKVGDHLLWYAKSLPEATFNRLFQEKLGAAESLGDLQSQGVRSTGSYGVIFRDKEYRPLSDNHWKVREEGMSRVIKAGRIEPTRTVIRFRRIADDFPLRPISDVWFDTSGGAGSDKVYVVQTAAKVIERCMLMTTDPGDLVLDPTSGSGSTATVAETWGRRWIAIDTSRVAVAIARQRILTTTFDHYKLKDKAQGPAGGFNYKTVPHVTLRSIAQNVALDPVFAKHEPILAERLDTLNGALAIHVSPELRASLAAKLAAKERREGKRSITDADRRRWLLPKDEWREWEVPFDTDPDWPAPLAEALVAYRAAWRAKMDEVNATISASAEQEELVDQPQIERGVTRVSGPFTVEAVMPSEERLDGELSPIDEPDDPLETFASGAGSTNGSAGGLASAGGDVGGAGGSDAANVEAYVDEMVRLLRGDGVRFPDNKQVAFSRLERLSGAAGGRLHAEVDWAPVGGAVAAGGEGDGRAGGGEAARSVAVVIGPQYGPITAKLVEDCLWAVSRLGYDDLLFAGFQFDAMAQAVIQDDPNPRVRVHQATIRPDVTMTGLLKEMPNSQLFTVFGLPRTRLDPAPDGTWTVTMEGVDVYNPVENTVVSTGASKVAAWFVDTDYDGRTFCICQAFFPDASAWTKLARALKGVVDEDAFAQFSGTTSLPFPTGTHKRIAVKVIDPRGNEVLRVHALAPEAVYAAP